MTSQLEVSSQLGQGSKFYFNIKTEIKKKSLEFDALAEKLVLVIDSDTISGDSLTEKIHGIGYKPIFLNDLDKAFETVTNNPKIQKIFISSDYDSILIIDLFKKLQNIKRRIHVLLYAFKLYNKDFIQEEFSNLKYEYISRPLSRRKIREIFSEFDDVQKNIINTRIVTNKRIQILIAEDNRVNMKLAKTFIRSFLSNVKIHEAKNGLEVLNLLEEERVDLIFMDIQMPLMDGIEATKKIRAFNKNVPIIGLTALTEEDAAFKSKAIGMNDYITKPISKEKIFNTLETWINR
jgi:CheY-like chemotaxis protein